MWFYIISSYIEFSANLTLYHDDESGIFTSNGHAHTKQCWQANSVDIWPWYSVPFFSWWNKHFSSAHFSTNIFQQVYSKIEEKHLPTQKREYKYIIYQSLEQMFPYLLDCKINKGKCCFSFDNIRISHVVGRSTAYVTSKFRLKANWYLIRRETFNE